jgi:hypothetical protein
VRHDVEWLADFVADEVMKSKYLDALDERSRKWLHLHVHSCAFIALQKAASEAVREAFEVKP